MRFGWLAAAAAMVCAVPASAETITQGFLATFMQNGSTGPVVVGGLNLGPNQIIRSATVFYDAALSLRAGFATFPNVTDTGTITYTGSVGFTIATLPISIGASNPISGTQACSAGLCSLDFRLKGTFLVPDADLPVFAGTTILATAPTGTINYNITYNGGPAFLAQQSRTTAVQGRIVYDVTSVPEPASWAMMLTGIGLAGALIRRRRVRFAAA